MLEETGIVVTVEGNHAWIETQAKSACGHCQVGSNCGTSLLAQWFDKKGFANKRNRVLVTNHLNLKQGEHAVVGISDDMLIKAAFMAYMLPLFSMLIFAMLSSGLGASNFFVALGSLLGLVIGLMSIRLLNRSAGKATVSLVRRAARENHIPIESLFTDNLTKRG